MNKNNFKENLLVWLNCKLETARNTQVPLLLDIKDNLDAVELSVLSSMLIGVQNSIDVLNEVKYFIEGLE